MINKSFCLKNKNIILTGCSGFLGEYISKALIKEEAKVIMLDIVKPKFKYDSKYGNFFKCDLTSEKEILKVMKLISKQYKYVDVLINNAASKGKDKKNFYEDFEKYKLKKLNDVMNANLNTMFLISKLFLKLLKKSTSPSIILLSSVFSSKIGADQRVYRDKKGKKLDFNNPVSYQLSKSAVVGFGKYLSTYYGDLGIRVNTILPGGVFNYQDKTFVKKYSEKVPLGRMAKPHEVVNPIIFLSSDAASYITGQNIFVDGGLSSW